MDLLSDALLLEVFSQLRPPDLLDSVALVCRRWLRLSRDPGAWRRAELSCCAFTQDKRRVLHLAPRLRRLSVWPSRRPEDRVAFLSGVSRVDQLSVHPRSSEQHGLVGARDLAELLLMYQPHLRQLYLAVPAEEEPPSCLWAVIAAMPHLTSLTLCGVDPVTQYRGEFSRSCPPLRRLHLNTARVAPCGTSWSGGEKEGGGRLDYDLVWNARNTLTHVKVLGPGSRWLRPCVPALGHCRGLRALRPLPAQSLVLLQNMPHLTSLAVVFDRPLSPQAADILQESVRMAPLCLEELDVAVRRRVARDGEDGEDALRLAGALLLALAERCGRLRFLALAGNWPPDVLSVLFASLPRLEEADVRECGRLELHHVLHLASLPSLCRLYTPDLAGLVRSSSSSSSGSCSVLLQSVPQLLQRLRTLRPSLHIVH